MEEVEIVLKSKALYTSIAHTENTSGVQARMPASAHPKYM